MGLAIVSQLVELHGGTVAVASPGVDRGATFIVKLPEVARDSSLNRDRRSPDHFEAKDLLQNCQILIVDDEADSRDVLIATLEEQGALVTAVDSAAEALAALSKLASSLIISDIGMPQVDGYSLMAQIRQLPLRDFNNTLPNQLMSQSYSKSLPIS